MKPRVDRISEKKKVKLNGERFSRAVNGLIILEISLEMEEL